MSVTAAESPFTPGDIVQLRSGGPFMTVIGVSEDRDRMGCGWFWAGRYQSAVFATHQLNRADAEAVQAAANLKSRTRSDDRA